MMKIILKASRKPLIPLAGKSYSNICSGVSFRVNRYTMKSNYVGLQDYKRSNALSQVE